MFPCPNCHCERCTADRDHTALLDRLFGEMQDPKDWRAPIDYHTREDDPFFKDRLEAITHFTATHADIMHIGDGRVRLHSVGYRNGPAGP